MLGFFSFLASLVGLFRDRILASHFGASRTLDIYYSAFKIPDLIFNLIVLGAVSSAFIPVFIEHYRQDKEHAWRLSNNFLSTSLAGVLILAGVIFVFANSIVRLIAPGFSGNDLNLTIRLTRLMLLSPIIFSISTIIGSILQALERFWTYAIAPVLYNVGIIIGAIYFVPMVRAQGYPEVLGLGLGVILGALMHLLVQLPAALIAGFRPRMLISFVDEGFRKILKLMMPRTLGLGAYSIDSAITNAIASTMAAGSIAIFNFANNLQFVPISVVGISTAIAIFPRLSFHASGNEKVDFKSKLTDALKRTAVIVLALAILMVIFSQLIIRILFGVGLFKGASVGSTAAVLSIFMLGVVAQSLIPIMSRAFYAMQNTKTPVLISIFSIIINTSLALFFSFVLHWGVKGLALAFSISGNFNFILLWLLFTRFFKTVK